MSACPSQEELKDQKNSFKKTSKNNFNQTSEQNDNSNYTQRTQQRIQFPNSQAKIAEEGNDYDMDLAQHNEPINPKVSNNSNKGFVDCNLS